MLLNSKGFLSDHLDRGSKRQVLICIVSHAVSSCVIEFRAFFFNEYSNFLPSGICKNIPVFSLIVISYFFLTIRNLFFFYNCTYVWLLRISASFEINPDAVFFFSPQQSVICFSQTVGQSPFSPGWMKSGSCPSQVFLLSCIFFLNKRLIKWSLLPSIACVFVTSTDILKIPLTEPSLLPLALILWLNSVISFYSPIYSILELLMCRNP